MVLSAPTVPYQMQEQMWTAVRGGEGCVCGRGFTPSYSVLNLVPGVTWVLLMGFLLTWIRGRPCSSSFPLGCWVGQMGFLPTMQSRSPSSLPLTERDQRLGGLLLCTTRELPWAGKFLSLALTFL